MSATTIKSLETSGVLPKPMVDNIIGRVSEKSVVQQLAQKTPMPITGKAIAFQTTQPQAGVVGAGQLKPVTNMEVRSKVITPIKVAALMYWDMEARQADSIGYLKLMEEQAAAAITRAFDLAVLHGKDAMTGNTISGQEYVNQTTNRVELGTATKENGGISADLLAGTDLVNLADGFDFDVSGFAADKSMKSRVLGQTDTLGRAIYADGFDITKNIGSLLGAPVGFSRVVSGKVGAAEDTKVRAFAGDWSTLRYGFVQNITIRRSDQATIQDGGTTVHLFQQNMEAFVVEAQFGWGFTDAKAFVAYDDKV